jgi:hypothetical protein
MSELECPRNQAQENQTAWVSVEQAQRVEQVGDADLVNGQTASDRRRHLITLETHERSGWSFGADRIDQDHVIRIPDRGQKGQAQCPPVQDSNALRDVVEAAEELHRDDT